MLMTTMSKSDDDNDEDTTKREGPMMTVVMTMITKRGGKLHGRQSCITCYETETNNFDQLAVSGVRDDHHHHLLQHHHHCHSDRDSLGDIDKECMCEIMERYVRRQKKVTQMTLYATHQLVKSETIGWWSHLAPDLLTAAPKIAIKLSPKTPGVLLP